MWPMPPQGLVHLALDMGEPHFLQRRVVRTVWVHILAASSLGVEGSGLLYRQVSR